MNFYFFVVIPTITSKFIEKFRNKSVQTQLNSMAMRENEDQSKLNLFFFKKNFINVSSIFILIKHTYTHTQNEEEGQNIYTISKI